MHVCLYIYSVLCVCVYIYANAIAKLPARQLSLLKAAFARDCYLNKSTLMQLIQQTGLGRKKILAWFRNRRFSVSRRKKEGPGSSGEYFQLHVGIYLATYYSVFLSDFLNCLPSWNYFRSQCMACLFASMLCCIFAFLPAFLLIHVHSYLNFCLSLPGCLPIETSLQHYLPSITHVHCIFIIMSTCIKKNITITPSVLIGSLWFSNS